MMMNMGIGRMASAMVVAALLLGACGSDDDGTAQAAEAVSASDDVSGPTTTPPATEEPASDQADDSAAPDFTDEDAVAVVNAIGQAYNEYDVDLFMASTAEDFVFIDERGTTPRAVQASYFPALRDGRHNADPTDEPVVISRDPFVVAVDTVVTASFYPPEGRVGTSAYTLEVENGELKVQEHRWTGDPL